MAVNWWLLANQKLSRFKSDWTIGDNLTHLNLLVGVRSSLKTGVPRCLVTIHVSIKMFCKFNCICMPSNNFRYQHTLIMLTLRIAVPTPLLHESVEGGPMRMPKLWNARQDMSFVNRESLPETDARQRRSSTMAFRVEIFSAGPRKLSLLSSSLRRIFWSAECSLHLHRRSCRLLRSKPETLHKAWNAGESLQLASKPVH